MNISALHFLFGLLVLACTALTGCAQQESAPEVRGIAYAFERDGQTGYLFGSVHFGDASFYPLNAAALKAFDASNVLVVEIDDSTITPDAQQEMLVKYGLYPDGETLAEHLSPRNKALMEELLAEFGIPFEAIAQYRPGFVATTLMANQAQKLGYSSELGIDRFFMTLARGKKTIRAIETFEFQMQLLSRMPEDEAVLHESLRNMKDYERLWAEMISAWKTGDAERLYETSIGEDLKAHPELAPYYDILFFDRHPSMVSSAEQCIASKERCFIVVGAGHLVGERGIVTELRKKGYTVSQL